MVRGERLAADAVHAQLLSHTRIYERASRRLAAHGDVVNAVVFAWGADISMVQTCLFERQVIVRRAPVRTYFGSGQALVSAMSTVPESRQPWRTAAEQLLALREQVIGALPSEEAQEIAGRLPDLTYLAELAAPHEAELHAGPLARLQGTPASDFAAARRREANELMLSALSASARSEEHLAIELAYESDFRTLEAYLVESALAAGDTGMWTVELRWELVKVAMGKVRGLPEAFHDAVHVIRQALAAGLGEPDGSRLLEYLPDVGVAH